MMGIGEEWVRGAEKSTGRVTNGRQPGCQLTVAILHGGLVNENDRKRGEKEEAGKRAGLVQVPPKSSRMRIRKGSRSDGSDTELV